MSSIWAENDLVGLTLPPDDIRSLKPLMRLILEVKSIIGINLGNPAATFLQIHASISQIRRTL